MPPSDMLLNTGTYAALLEHLSPGSISYDPRPEDVGLFSPRHENQKTLARLAQVCRTTSGPALALLWRSIDKFEHLLYLFSSYNMYERMFTDTVKDAEWTRFREYAPCVRELKLNDLLDMHSSIWMILIQGCVREPFLPRLERLASLPMDSMSACYTMLLSPTIRHLGLTFNSSTRDAVVCMAVGLIQPILAQLTSLSVMDWQNGYHRTTYTRMSLWELNHLQELRIKDWVPLDQNVETLSGYSHLRVLHLRVSSSTFKDTQPALTKAFRNLRELELTGPLEGIDHFLQVATPPVLDNVSFVVEVSSRDDLGGDQLWNAILSHLSLLTLRAFRAAYKPVMSYDGRIDPTTLLGMLVPFSHLESLVLVYDQVASHLYDSCLHSIQNAWPELTVFEVVVLERPLPRHGHRSHRQCSPVGGYMPGAAPRSTPYYWGDPPPSIATLADFAAAHPRLKQLTVPALDLSEVPDVASVPHLCHSLRTLRINAVINDAPLLPFALALDLLFPNLDLRAVDYKVIAPTGPAEVSQQLFALLLAVQIGRVGAYRAHAPLVDAQVERRAADEEEGEDGDEDEDVRVNTIRLKRLAWTHPSERWRTGAHERRSHSPSSRGSPSPYVVMPPPPIVVPPVVLSRRPTSSGASSVDHDGGNGKRARREAHSTEARRDSGWRVGLGVKKERLKRFFRAVATPFRRGGPAAGSSDRASSK
ncbi:hypothetical protein C8Q73DRAFT_182601 [Cubamyces lactineus]|nr:hypothetical protein C8Q73DRAFT_182601 [Cubamyces lactineus]